MSKRNGVDPWCEVPTEEIEIGGIKAEVHGLSILELTTITKAHKDDMEAVSLALVCACCERGDGVKLTPETVGKYRPDVYKTLNEAVARVNGFASGNSNATDADASSSV